MLRVALYNPFSLLSAGRSGETAETMNCDLILLPGTRVGEWPGRDYHTENIGNKFGAMHFGRQRAPF
eukprot:3049878-Pyramimonas_sp.AAC.1